MEKHLIAIADNQSMFLEEQRENRNLNSRLIGIFREAFSSMHLEEVNHEVIRLVTPECEMEIDVGRTEEREDVADNSERPRNKGMKR